MIPGNPRGLLLARSISARKVQERGRVDTPRFAAIARGLALGAVLAVALGGVASGGPGAGDTPAAAGTAHPSGIVADPADWCAGCGLPESMCTVCNPGLTAAFKAKGDWCAEHGFPESVCPVCNPVPPPGASSGHRGNTPVAASGSRVGDPSDWCAGCGLPESMCTVCSPGLIGHFKAEGDWCAAHGFPESVCPVCNPMQPPSKAAHTSAPTEPAAPRTVIRFNEPAIERSAGIATVPATTGSMGIDVECTATVDFDRNVTADIRSPVEGIVREILVDLGQQVSAGDRLFTLESSDVGDLQARHRAARERAEAARTNLTRKEALHADAVASQRQVELARQEFEAADAELRSMEQSLRLNGAGQGDSNGRFTIHAPIDGTIVRRPALMGTWASTADSLATISDTSVMWALLDVPEWDAAVVRIGQHVDLRVDGVAGDARTGSVSWIASEVDPKTRSVTARAEIPNPDGLLRAGQFARAEVRVAAPRDAATVPAEAVQRVDDGSVVFVRVGEGVFEPRTVSPGRSDGRHVQVTGDIEEGEAVVTTGAFLLRTELSRESIGAGCCEVEGPGGG